MSEKNCGNCKFGANFTEDQPNGACRRYPPTLMVQPLPAPSLVGRSPGINWDNQASAMPLVAKGGWCGEHADKPSAIFNS